MAPPPTRSPRVTPTSPRPALVPSAGASTSLDRRIFYLHAIAQIGRTLARVGTLDRLLVEIVDYFTEIATVRWTCVYLRDGGSDHYRLSQSKFAVPEPGWSPPESIPEATLAALWEGDAPLVVEGEPFTRFPCPCHFLPLFTEGAPTGFLLFGGKLDGGEMLPDEREFLSTLATQAALAIRHAILLGETARMVEELTVLNDISSLFARADEPFEDCLHGMWKRLEPFLKLEAGLLVPMRAGVEDVVLGGARDEAGERERTQRWCELLLAERDRGGQLRKGDVLILDGDEVEQSFPAEFRPPDVAGRAFGLLPVFYDQELEALLVFRAEDARGLLRGYRPMLQNLSPALSSALQKSRDRTKLERLATTDGLTGLYNHRYFHDKLQQEYLRAYRLKGCVGLLFIDVDHFKSVNDAFGHVYGDQVLTRAAEALRGAVRDIDVVARYGGEEFAVILPQAAAEEAGLVAERVRFTIEQTVAPRLDRKIERFTVSVGAASYPETASTKDELVEAADRALYLAKRAGRNRVTVARQTSSASCPAPETTTSPTLLRRSASAGSPPETV